MKIVRSCGVSSIATYLSLTRQDLPLAISHDDRLNAFSDNPESDAMSGDPASENHA